MIITVNGRQGQGKSVIAREIAKMLAARGFNATVYDVDGDVEAYPSTAGKTLKGATITIKPARP